MQNNIFPSNHIKNNNCINNLSGHVHSCPFCKCKSLDNLDKLNPKHYAQSSIILPSQNPFISNPNLSQNSSNFNNKASNIQNVYYRPFDKNKRESISPNFNKKIVINYLSPELKYPQTLTKSVSVPFNQQKNNHFQSFKPFPTKISPTPRTIYTNQSTPPKAKFLQKRESKKKSPQKVTFEVPFKDLRQLQFQKAPISKKKEQSNFHVPYQPFKFLSLEKIVSIQKTQQYYQPNRAEYLQGIYKTSTKNLIQHKSQTPQSVGSPFNSLFDTTPQVVPFGSFSSTPLIANDASQKRQRQSSINQIAQFNEQVEEVRLDRKISEPVQIQKYEFIPKQIQINRIQYRKDQKFDEKFEKTLGKNDYDPRLVTQNELIYSQSDQKTIQNLGGSQKNLFQSKSMRMNSNQTRSERNMRMIPDDFGKKKSKFDFAELSDNFETPKSKYKTVKESKINDSKKSIKFKVVGENRKSKISIGSKQSINQLMVQNSIKLSQQKEKQAIENKSAQIKQEGDQKQLLKHQSLIKKKKEESKYVIKEEDMFDRDEGKEVSIMSHQVKTIEVEDSLAVSNQYAGQLTQQLKLNYDYYLFQPKHNIKLSNKHSKQDMNTKLPDSGNQYLPDSSASSHGTINISF